MADELRRRIGLAQLLAVVARVSGDLFLIVVRLLAARSNTSLSQKIAASKLARKSPDLGRIEDGGGLLARPESAIDAAHAVAGTPSAREPGSFLIVSALRFTEVTTGSASSRSLRDAPGRTSGCQEVLNIGGTDVDDCSFCHERRRPVVRRPRSTALSLVDSTAIISASSAGRQKVAGRDGFADGPVVDDLRFSYGFPIFRPRFGQFIEVNGV